MSTEKTKHDVIQPKVKAFDIDRTMKDMIKAVKPTPEAKVDIGATLKKVAFKEPKK